MSSSKPAADDNFFSAMYQDESGSDFASQAEVSSAKTGWVKNNLGATAVAVCMVAMMVLIFLPAQYAVSNPGPTFDVLSENDKGQLIHIDGAPTYATTGELRITTVTQSRAGAKWGSWGYVIKSHLNPQARVQPAKPVSEEDREQEAEEGKWLWATSQDAAAVVALEFLGYEVPVTIAVVGFNEDSLATALAEGDIILEINGQAVVSTTTLSDELADLDPGTEITLLVDRAGSQVEVTVPTIADDNGKAVMGIFVAPTPELPIDVQIGIEHVAGSSAGMMFTLAIIDMLTPEDELAGAKIAGTGTMEIGHNVGPIGGIAFKLDGAKRDGAEYFLAPKVNCDEVIGHIPEGLHVVAVETIDDAYNAMVAIGKGEVADLPTCE